MKKAEIEKRLENAKITLKNLKRRKKPKVTISKDALIKYCDETISLCRMILKVMKKYEPNK